MSENKPSLSREFVLRSILKLFDAVETEQRWGAVSVIFQAGKFRCIKEEQTITDEKEVIPKSAENEPVFGIKTW